MAKKIKKTERSQSEEVVIFMESVHDFLLKGGEMEDYVSDLPQGFPFPTLLKSLTLVSTTASNLVHKILCRQEYLVKQAEIERLIGEKLK